MLPSYTKASYPIHPSRLSSINSCSRMHPYQQHLLLTSTPRNPLIIAIVIVFVLLPALCISEDTFTPSRATYYGSPDCYGTPTGACGYGEDGRTINDGNVAAVSNTLFRNGTGCGACYQVRCSNPEYCDETGAYVVVTDHGEGDRTDFILSPRAFAKLGYDEDTSTELFKCGVVEIQYRRVPCQSSSYTLAMKVHPHSKFPEYLAIAILTVYGENDVTAVELWQEDCKEWRAFRRAYGAVWDFPNPPRNGITFRYQISGSAGTTWVQSENVLSGQWKIGTTYYVQA